MEAPATPDPASKGKPERSEVRKYKLIIAGILGALLAIVIIQNAVDSANNIVTFSLIGWGFEVHKLVLMLFSLLVGFVLGWLVGHRPKKKAKADSSPASA